RNPGGSVIPLSRIIHRVTADEHGGVVDTAIVFNREFVDNTYGTGSIGWDRGGHAGLHTFSDLDHSDHVELAFLDRDGATRFQGRIDYLTQSTGAPSGYRTLGLSGGDGRLIAGALGDVTALGSSLDDNFNRYGYVLTDNSPPTDAQYA